MDPIHLLDLSWKTNPMYRFQCCMDIARRRNMISRQQMDAIAILFGL